MRARSLMVAGLAVVVSSGMRAQKPAAPAGSARAVAQRALSALATQDAAAFAREASPQDLAAFRTQFLPTAKKAFDGQQREQVLAMFPPAKTYADIEKLPPERLFSQYLQGVMARMAANGPLQVSNSILGEVAEADSMTHIVYRQRVAAGTDRANNVAILSLRRTPGGWKVVLQGGQLGMGPPQGAR
jgi:hypothetical protein